MIVTYLSRDNGPTLKEYRIKCPPEYANEAFHCIKAFNRDYKFVDDDTTINTSAMYELNTGRDYVCHYTNKGTTVVRYWGGSIWVKGKQ